jgi:site-specific recombinase XerD
MVRIEEKFRLNTSEYKTLLEEFHKLVIVIGYKAKLRAYEKAIQEFLWHCETNEIYDIRKVRSIDLVNYHNYLSNRENLVIGGKLSRSYVANHMHSLNIFFDYLLQNNVIEGTVILPSRPIGIERTINILTVEEINEVYEGLKKKIDKAFFSIAYGCGLRRNELIELNVTDLLLNKGILIVRCGKNEKRREIPMSNSVLRDVQKYLFEERDKKINPNQTTPAFFVSNFGNRMTGCQFYTILRSIINKTNNEVIKSKKITLHTLRHSISSHLINNGASIEYVKNFLGHSDIDTSHIYAKRRKMRNIILKQIQ